MAHLNLAGWHHKTVVVDHCAACRLVWFDTLESVRLSALGWVELLRTMQQPGAAANEPVAAHAGCPDCRTPLRLVHNQTRFGRFRVRQCPQGHGHLHTHTGLLAERGLVRPLLPLEKQTLRDEQRTLECLNCGAAADGSSDDCRYCASPLVVVDMPRLAHALSGPAERLSASPRPDGRVVAWNCRGCGSALDPSRQAACPACAHPVVVPSLLDITPVLDAAAAAPQGPHLPDEVNGMPRPRLRRVPLDVLDSPLAGLGEGWRDPRDDAPVPPWRLALAGLVVALVVWLFFSITNAHAAKPAGPARDGSEAAAVLAAQPLGPDPDAAWHWSAAMAAMRPPGESMAFDRGLFDATLAISEGVPWQPGRTVAETVARGRALPDVATDNALRQRWSDGLRRRWQLVWPDGAVPIPAELESLAPRMRERAPGLWTSVLADGQPRAAIWATTWQLGDERTLAVPAPVVRLQGFSALPIEFDCQPPRGTPPVAWQPGQRVSLLCRSLRPVAGDEPVLAEIARRLAARDAAVLALTTRDLDDAEALHRYGQGLAAASAASSPLEAFYIRFTNCGSRGDCPANVRAQQAADAAAIAAMKTRQPDMEQPEPPRRGRDLAAWPMSLVPPVVLGLGVLYATLAALLSNGRALKLSLLGGFWLAPTLATKFMAPGSLRGSGDFGGHIFGLIATLGLFLAGVWLAWALLMGMYWLGFSMVTNRVR